MRRTTTRLHILANTIIAFKFDNNKVKKINAPTSVGLINTKRTKFSRETRHICSITAKTFKIYICRTTTITTQNGRKPWNDKKKFLGSFKNDPGGAGAAFCTVSRLLHSWSSGTTLALHQHLSNYKNTDIP